MIDASIDARRASMTPSQSCRTSATSTKSQKGDTSVRLLTMFFVLPNIVYFNLVACDPPTANWPKEGRFNAQCHNILIYVFYDILPLFVKYQNLTAISIRILKSARTSADLNFRHQSFLPAISAFCLLANGPEC